MLGTLVPWVGKLTGTMIFEPILERVGYRNIMYIVGVIQIIALISEYSPSYPWMKSPSSIASREEYATDSRVVEMTSHDWRVFSLGRVSPTWPSAWWRTPCPRIKLKSRRLPSAASSQAAS